MGTRHRCNHKPAGLRLPPCINEGASVSADFFVVPHPGLRIYRLADGAKDSQGIQFVLGRPLVSKTHQRANSRWCRIENRNAEFVANLPETSCIRISGNAFKHQRCSAVCKRAINNVAVTGYPANVGGAPVDIVIVNIENNFVSKGDVHQVSTCCVDNSLGLAC